MYGYATCPNCDCRFMVPADATGAEIECTECGWVGTCTDIDDAPEHPEYAPPLTAADMTYVIYGMPISVIGEDSEFTVALGHVNKVGFVGVVNKLFRDEGYGPIAADSLDEALKYVEHRWAVNRPVCPYTGIMECPYGDCMPSNMADEYAWNITLDAITKETPGAFPVTLGTWA